MLHGLRIRQVLALALYYFIAQHLPERSRPGGEAGRRLRATCCKQLFAESGNWINVGPRVDIGRGTAIRLGQGSSIGRDSRVSAAVIGDRVMIGPELLVVARNHDADYYGQRLARNASFSPPEIGDGTWIGARVTILPGVRIGKGCVIGAGAVVSRDIPSDSVAVGVPARVVRQRE